ncbi:MAG: hypothetical protein QOI80_3136, partial [Solirubrobacteraceae bacterium]|nr:hypothetical protein [Solirubrobacteraceae bacterium]
MAFRPETPEAARLADDAGVRLVAGDVEAVRSAAAEPGEPILALAEAGDRRTVTALLAAGAKGVAL